jgi:hypothetical protein
MSPASPTSDGRDALFAALAPILEALRSAEPTDRDLARRLSERFPLDGPVLTAVAAGMRRGLDEGWLCPRENAGVRFGRLAKPDHPATFGMSIDAVKMDAPGPGHTHPKGEIDLCFALDGDPTFDGHAPGWTVYPPGSWHVPTVRGGTMAILYFLPGGEIEFGARE